MDEERKKILLYSDSSFSVYHIDIQTLDKTVIRTNKILFMQKLKYKNYIASSESDCSVHIFDLIEGKYQLQKNFQVSKSSVFFIHEVLENRFIVNVDKERFALVDYLMGEIIYYKSVPFSKNYRKRILLPDGRLLTGCSKKFLIIK